MESSSTDYWQRIFKKQQLEECFQQTVLFWGKECIFMEWKIDKPIPKIQVVLHKLVWDKDVPSKLVGTSNHEHKSSHSNSITYKVADYLSPNIVARFFSTDNLPVKYKSASWAFMFFDWPAKTS